MHFGNQVLKYHFQLQPDVQLPQGIKWLMPYEHPETRKCMQAFYSTFYRDNMKRTFILGINPGRFGAGLTGVPFTDPIRLEQLGIHNKFPKKPELSSVFIYEMVDRCGGPDIFFKQYYIASLSPLGLTRNGLNYNYYDDAQLARRIEPFIIRNIETQMAFGANKSIVFCLGQGKNYDYLKKLNDRHRWWKKVEPLPHPRWIMQYRLKRKEDFLKQYADLLCPKP
jgi:hypothetical protein